MQGAWVLASGEMENRTLGLWVGSWESEEEGKGAVRGRRERGVRRERNSV